MSLIHPKVSYYSSTTSQEQETGRRDITAQEQEQAEKQLHFQANILQHIQDSVIVTDLQGTITYWNEGTHRLFGFTAEELAGQSISQLIPAIDASQLSRGLQHIADGHDFARQMQHRKQDDSTIWVEVKVTLLRTEEGNPCGFIGITTDISQHKIAEARLQRSEKLFRALVENSTDAIGLLTAHGEFLYVSPSTERVLGFRPEDLVGHHALRELVHPDDLELTRQVFAAILREPGKSFNCEYRLRHKDGSWRWIDGNAMNLQDDPHVAAIVVNYRDITPRKLLAEELKRSRDQLEAILKNAGDGILVQDTTGKMIYVNQAVADKLGFDTPEDVLAAEPYAFLEWLDITGEDGQPFAPAHFPGRRAILGEENPAITVRSVHKYTHEAYWSHIKSTVVRDRDNAPLFIISVMQDITQFKELEQQKNEFITHVGHELRTPLTSLSGFLQIINDFRSQLDEATVTTFLARSLENCRELILLVNEVLEVLQFGHETKTAHAEAIALHALVREVIAQLGPQIEQDYQLQLDISEDLTVRANRKHLCQIVRNLLSNVFKYAPIHTPVIISATTQEEDSGQKFSSTAPVTISIQDRGPGIPPAEQAQLFEKFSRLKRDLASPVRGSGLGLYICKQLVEKMGGRIWVESSGQKGEGSRFCFTLPGEDIHSS